jgi:hypothetical protein
MYAINCWVPTEFEAQALAPLILMLRPQSGASQTVIQADLQFNPHLKATEYFDLYGNACHRLLIPPGSCKSPLKSPPTPLT